MSASTVWRGRCGYCRKTTSHHTIMSHYMQTHAHRTLRNTHPTWLVWTRNWPRNRPRNVRFRLRLKIYIYSKTDLNRPTYSRKTEKPTEPHFSISVPTPVRTFACVLSGIIPFEIEQYLILVYQVYRNFPCGAEQVSDMFSDIFNT